ncbi:MAG: type II toxin-antitoxin system RelE/ParE family toxin [Sedimenticola sp.]
MDIYWQPKAVRQIKKLVKRERAVAEQIKSAVGSLMDYPNAANVKALVNHKYSHRLQVGNYRVLFNGDEVVQIISIEEVKKRDEHTY